MSDRKDCEDKIKALEEALTGTDMEAIKSREKALEECFQAIATKVYQQAAAQQQAAPGQDGAQGAHGASDDGVVDAEFTDAN